MEKLPTLLAYREDFENRNFWDWLKSSALWVEPFHRYKGTLALEKDWFGFSGKDIQNGTTHTLFCLREQVVSTRLGFDDTFKATDDPTFFGTTFKPLRVEIQNGNHLFVCYLLTNFNSFLRTTNNQHFQEQLEKWRVGNLHF